MEGKLKLTYNRENNEFMQYYDGNDNIRIQWRGRDLNTNLGCIDFYTHFNGASSVAYFAPENYWKSPHPSGFEMEAYYDGKMVFSKKFQYKKLDLTYRFETYIGESTYEMFAELFHNEKWDGNEEYTNLRKDDVVYDLGANYGIYTMWAVSQNVKQVYAIEPTPKNVSYMKETFKWDNNVSIIEKAISDKEKDITFYTWHNSVCNSIQFKENYTPIKVKCINLEKYINDYNLLPPTYIKCDIEGEEYKFLESSSDKFLKQLRGMYLEYHFNGKGENNIHNIIDRMLSLGFSIKQPSIPDQERGMGTLIFSKS